MILLVPGAVLMTVLAVWLMVSKLGEGATIDQARNAVLLIMVLFQNAYLLGIRNLRRPFWLWSEAENGRFAGLLAALALHLFAIHFGPLQDMLGTGPLTIDLLAPCLAVGLAVLLVTEAAKSWVAFHQRAALANITPAAGV